MIISGASPISIPEGGGSQSQEGANQTNCTPCTTTIDNSAFWLAMTDPFHPEIIPQTHANDRFLSTFLQDIPCISGSEICCRPKPQRHTLAQRQRHLVISRVCLQVRPRHARLSQTSCTLPPPKVLDILELCLYPRTTEERGIFSILGVHTLLSVGLEVPIPQLSSCVMRPKDAGLLQTRPGNPWQNALVQEAPFAKTPFLGS